MDLGRESVEENEVNHDVEENEVNHDENGNGGDYCGNEKFELGFEGNSDVNNGLDQKGTVVEVEVGSGERVNSKGTPTKGVGLKKWRRRIRREVVKDPNSSADSEKVLKRGLSGNLNLSENQPFQRDVKERSEGSSNMFGNAVFSEGNMIPGSSSDSRYAIGSGFAVGTNSENSEDRSSKSSSAASDPKLRHEKNRSKNVNSKHVVNSAQRVQQGKGETESSKKPGGGGGGKVKIEKENSFSSLESDSRSSNFKQGVFAVISNGKHSGRPNVYDGVNSGEAHTNYHFTEGVESGYGNENIVENEEDLLPENLTTNLSWDGTEEKSVNNQSSTIEDPLIESISSLQAVQEALQEELQKFREIEIEAISPDDDSAKCSSGSAGITTFDLELHKSSQSGAEEIQQTASSSLDPQVLGLTHNINSLESKLEELQDLLDLKDARIAELETSLSRGKTSREETPSTVALLEKCKEVETELEGIFRLKIEAEVEYLTISKVMQNLKDVAGSQLTLLEEQEKLSESQAEVLDKLVDAESKASVLKNKVEELEKYCDDSVVVEESFVLQRRVCKATFFLFLQFMLLVLVFWDFMSQLSHNSGMVVPT